MRKNVSFVIAALLCFVLAQVGISLWSTFNAGGEQWRLELYSPAVPSAAVDWLIHAIAIAFVAALAVTLRHRWGFGTLVSLVVAGAFGAVVIPLFFSAIHTAAFGEFGIDKYSKTYTEALWFMVTLALMTQQAMVAHVITAAIAAMLGIGFGRHLTMNAPSGPSVLGVIVTRVLAIVRRLRTRDPQAMLKASET